MDEEAHRTHKPINMDRLFALIEEINAKLPEGLIICWRSSGDAAEVSLANLKNKDEETVIYSGTWSKAIAYLEGIHFCAYINDRLKFHGIQTIFTT